MFKDSGFSVYLSACNVSNGRTMKEMFGSSTSSGINANIGFGAWNVSSVTNFNKMFQKRIFPTSSGGIDITQWDTASAVDMTYMFTNGEFNQDISNWDVSSVTNFQNMLYYVSNFDQPSVKYWKTNLSDSAKYNNMFFETAMYNDTSSYWYNKNPPTSADFNQFRPYVFSTKEDIQNAIVEYMDDQTTAQAKYGDITFWVLPATITDLNSLIDAGTLAGVAANGGLYNDFNFDISTKVVTVNGVAQNDSNGNPYIAWDMSHVTDISLFLTNQISFNQDIGNWDTSSVTSAVSMFTGATSFNQNINTKEVTVNGNTYDAWKVNNIVSFAGFFNGANAFDQDLNSWDVTGSTIMSSMFSNTNMNGNISSWNVSNVTTMNGMFANSPFNQDISGWNVSNCSNFTNTFKNTPFNQDISGWNVSSATTMEGMFQGATSFNQDLREWVVVNVINFGSMFSGANGYTNEDLKFWNLNTTLSAAVSPSPFENMFVSSGFNVTGHFGDNAQGTPTYDQFNQIYRFRPSSKAELITAVNMWVNDVNNALSLYLSLIHI